MPLSDIAAVLAQAVGTTPAPNAVALLLTGLVLGLRHGIDWDHIAAITDITSTTAGGLAAEEAHADEHGLPGSHTHGHGDETERAAHGTARGVTRARPGDGPGAMLATPELRAAAARDDFVGAQRRAVVLGTLYAIGHALVVGVLGVIALAFGATLPEWLDPIMGRVVGLTLVVLGAFVFVSLYQYARYGQEFRLRSRWMLAFDGVRYAWRRVQARLHGHEHAEPLEMSAYGPRTALAVGMIHGIGAETGTQVLLITAIGGAAAAGLGVPMMFAFIVGLLISNTAIVVMTASGYVTTQLRRRIYLVVGVVAGAFSLVLGLTFLLQADGLLPDLSTLFAVVGA